jgi:hypothetical protein
MRSRLNCNQGGSGGAERYSCHYTNNRRINRGVNRQQRSDMKGEVGPTFQPKPCILLPDGLPEFRVNEPGAPCKACPITVIVSCESCTSLVSSTVVALRLCERFVRELFCGLDSLFLEFAVSTVVFVLCIRCALDLGS